MAGGAGKQGRIQGAGKRGGNPVPESKEEVRVPESEGNSGTGKQGGIQGAGKQGGIQGAGKRGGIQDAGNHGAGKRGLEQNMPPVSWSLHDHCLVTITERLERFTLVKRYTWHECRPPTPTPILFPSDSGPRRHVSVRISALNKSDNKSICGVS